MKIESKHLLTIIIVSVAILGQVVAMCVFQLESDAIPNKVKCMTNKPESPATINAEYRKGELVDSSHTES